MKTVCQFFLATFVALTIVSTRYGIGRHLKTATPDDLKVAMKLICAGEFFSILAVTVSKTSFAITLLHLAIERWHNILLWGIIASVNLIMGSCAIMLVAQCRPMEKMWDFAVEGFCLPVHVYFSYAVFAGGTFANHIPPFFPACVPGIFTSDYLRNTSPVHSLVCHDGYCPRHLPLGCHLAHEDANGQEDWRQRCNEPRGFVRSGPCLVVANPALMCAQCRHYGHLKDLLLNDWDSNSPRLHLCVFPNSSRVLDSIDIS